MTEVINVQVFNYTSKNMDPIDFQHRGINFHLEIHNEPTVQLNLLNETSLKVFLCSFYWETKVYNFLNSLKYLNYNNIKTKSLILELSDNTRRFLDKKIDMNVEYIKLNDKIFYNSETIKDKLLEMALENEEVIKSIVINSIFSKFLNQGRVYKNIFKEFCIENSLDDEYCLKILKENDNLFEYSGAYYFIHDKILESFQKILKYKFQKGLTTYTELENVFQEETDLVIKILESKNVLLKNQNNYAYLFRRPFMDKYKSPYGNKMSELNEVFSPSEHKNIYLKFHTKNDINFNLFCREISVNRKISSIGYDFIFLNDNCLITFNSNINSIFFFKYYDLEILISIMNLLPIKALLFYFQGRNIFSWAQIKYYLENFRNHFNIEEEQDLINMMNIIYPFFEAS